MCINKIDRPEARPNQVIDEVLDLFIELGAGEEYLDSPFIFTSAREGKATLDLDNNKDNMEDLFETIINYIPAPKGGDVEEPLQILISTIDYNDYVGRIGIGRIERGGKIHSNQEALIVNANKTHYMKKIKIGKYLNLKD